MRGLPLPTKADDSQFRELVDSARSGPSTAAEVAKLAMHLAVSGERLGWGSTGWTADVASTGGPGSLSTLLAPLWLVVFGRRVVKLAVPGRPAGAIDSLGTIPGYRVQLASDDVRSVVADCGFAHFLADQRFAPLDAALFEYRRRNGAVAVPTLAAASLLAKKLAVGVRLMGLDVRVGEHGNFGRSNTEARNNAALFCAAARLLGIEAVAFVASESGPVQPWIGRGESLVALAHTLGIRRVDGEDLWLEEHARDCWRMAATVAGVNCVGSVNQLDGPSSSALRTAADAFCAHLEAQGASLEGFLQRVDAVCAAPRETLRAERAGTVHLDLARLRDALVSAQECATTTRMFGDPAGVRLLSRPGSAVVEGEGIAVVRYGPEDAEALIERVRGALSISSDVRELRRRDTSGFEVVRA